MNIKKVNTFILLTALYYFSACSSYDDNLFQQALRNGADANEGFRRCSSFLDGWLAEADSATGLIPRNLTDSRDFWNAKDAAADNYPYMVLTAAILRDDLFRSTMLDMLNTETKLTSRIGRLPDTYSFSKQGFLIEKVDTNEIIFGSAEYMKDGLIPLTEWLGESPWSERMIGILDDLEKVMNGPLLQAPRETREKNAVYIASLEVSGDLLQILSRMYWMTGNKRYLERAIQLGDYYFSEENLPTRNDKGLRLRDHGCEIIGGLSEIYLTLHYIDKEKKKQWYPFIHEMLDEVLAKARNEDGLFYNSINPVSGEIVDKGIADTWGYILDAIYTVYLVDGTEEYREAAIKALQSICKYKNYAWEGSSSDGYADAIESAINLYFRLPQPEVEPWLDSEIRVMWGKQQPSGVIEGWHGDGNFARTTLMYCLWKTAGITISDWSEDVKYGATLSGDELYLAFDAANDWSGKVKFGAPMHHTNLRLPIDYPRINQFQEWCPVDADATYKITNVKKRKSKTIKGAELINGYDLALSSNEPIYIHITRIK